MLVSIIIVHYHVKQELFSCIESLFTNKTKVTFDVIVVDNDEKKHIKKELKERYPKVVYVSNDNKGFGEGNNVGAGYSKGKYLLFLNPDTKVFPGAIDNLVTFLKNHQDVGIVAPLLHDMRGRVYQQGALELTPLRGVVSLSFINKLFPNNPISQKYFLSHWDRKTIKEVDVSPGTAFMIRRSLFVEVGGFDEKFFLFFEEFDLCMRIRKLGWKIVIFPKAKVYHVWGASTKKSDKNIQKIFDQSRFYYFKKHFGLFSAIIVHLFTNTHMRIR